MPANNPEVVEARRAVVEAAQALVEQQIGIIEAARAIAWRCHTLDPKLDDGELNTFILIDSESDGLAIGELLENWHPDVRETKRQEVLEFEKFYERIARRDAPILVERYGRSA